MMEESTLTLPDNRGFVCDFQFPRTLQHGAAHDIHVKPDLQTLDPWWHP